MKAEWRDTAVDDPSICPYEGEEEAIQLANGTAFGLGGTVFTADADHGAGVARRIQSGVVGINGFALDHNAPMGGFKMSGLGREMGPEGLDAYIELKSIYLPKRTELVA